MTRDPTVLFVGGYGRSGSTLLDRMLGTLAPDVASAGEVRHLWQEGFVENRRCGCGEPFLSCPFWTAVVRDAFADGSELGEVMDARTVVDRAARIPLLASRRRPRRFQDALDRYTDGLARLYRAIARVSGRGIVVDSTKDPSHGWVLRATSGIDLRVLHLVRDSRAVAWSWQRKKYNPGSGADMARYSLVKTGLEWDAINLLVAGLGRAGVPSERLRYEDLVGDPARALERVLRFAGSAADVSGFDGREIELGVDHTVAGNPIRFERGRMALRRDDEWRRAMPVGNRRLVGALTWPVRTASGYRGASP